MKLFVAPSAVFIYNNPVDFRKSIDGLTILIENELTISPMSGALFIFFNRHKNKLKILFWDETGFMLCYKRLERGRFKLSKSVSEGAIEITEDQLGWLLSGFERG